MSQTPRIACLQTCPRADIASALEEALPLAQAAVSDGAEFLFLPEYCGGLKSDGAKLTPPAAREGEHGFLNSLRDFALENRVWIMLGSVAIAAADDKIVNRGFIIDDHGKIISRYDKIHLFDVRLSDNEVYAESATVVPGTQAVLVETPFGRIGHTICYDLRFPHLYRALAKAGADIIAVPAAFTKRTGQAHWHVLNRARAIENGVFVVSPCAIGEIPGGGESYGHSLIVDPWGRVLADGGTTPGVVAASIDLDAVADTRARIPSLLHDRPFTLHQIHTDRKTQ